MKAWLEYLKSTWKQHPIITSIACVGALTLAQNVWKLLGVGWKYGLRPKTDLWKKYGTQSAWAVVLGGSGQLGFAYTRLLAKAGFNVLLMGESVQLPLPVMEGLKAANSKVQVDYYHFDFTLSYSDLNYVELRQALVGKDIAILVNADVECVGQSFAEFPADRISSAIFGRTYPLTYLIRHVLPHMLTRPTRSAVVSVASPLVLKPVPYCQFDLAALAYVRALMKALTLELAGTKVDFLTCVAGPLSQAETKNWAVNLDEVAASHMAALGKSTTTYGTLRHYLYAHLPWTATYAEQLGTSLKVEPAPQ